MSPAPNPAGMVARERRATASAAAVYVGEPHPWATPQSEYARIVEQVGSRPESPAMRLGDLAEPMIARLARHELGLLAVRRCWRTYLHPDVPLAATPDCYATSPEGTPALLEVKLSSDFEMWRDLPPHVEWQARAQLACADRARCYVAVLLGSRLATWIVEREPEAEARLLDGVRTFFADHVAPRVPPPGEDDELTLTLAAPAGTAPATGALAAAGEELMTVVSERRRIEAREQELRHELARGMAAAGTRLLLGAGWRAEACLSASGITALRFTGPRGGIA